jgi:hypothetical protein
LVRITNGEVKTKDDLAVILERAKSATDFENRYKTYEQENADLKSKVEANPFANDYTKKLNDLYRGGASETQIQAFTMLNKVSNLDELSPMEARSLALQVKHGLSPDEANRYLNKEYGVDVSDPNSKLDPDEAIRLKIDSASDKDFLKTHKAEVSTVPVDNSAQQQELLQQQNEQRIQRIQPIAKNVVNDMVSTGFKGISINGKEGNDAIKIDLPMMDSNKSALQDAVDGYVKNYDIQPNEQGIKAIQDYAKNVAWIQNGERWLIEAASLREKQVRAEYHNPSSGNIPRGINNPETGKTSQQQKEDNIRKAVLGDY